jgi:ADP-glucose pyrophosphorylase
MILTIRKTHYSFVAPDHRVSLHFPGYWEDIGTVGVFEANLALTDTLPPYLFRSLSSDLHSSQVSPRQQNQRRNDPARDRR